MYVHNFAYTLYNAEFCQESDFEVKHRCYQRAFSRYVYITYFWSYTGNLDASKTYIFMLVFEPPTCRPPAPRLGRGGRHIGGCAANPHIYAFDASVPHDSLGRTL